MNVDKVKSKTETIGSSVRPAAVAALELEMGRHLPASYKELLDAANGFTIGYLTIYSAEEAAAYNRARQIQQFYPDYYSIGEAPCEVSIIIPYDRGGVFALWKGLIEPDYVEPISESLEEWVSEGCPFSIEYTST